MKKMNVKKFARTFLVLIAVFALACAFSSMAFAADGETAAAAPDNNMGIGMIAAALAVGGKVAAPVFNEEEKAKGLTDFNDLHKSRGIKEVQKQVGLSLLHDQGKTRELSL